jgi:hypothetical protein
MSGSDTDRSIFFTEIGSQRTANEEQESDQLRDLAGALGRFAQLGNIISPNQQHGKKKKNPF